MKRRNQLHGFTLLETIAVFLLISVTAVMLLSYTRASVDRSAEPPLLLADSFDLSAQMAVIASAHTNDLETFRQTLLGQGVDAQFVVFPTNAPHNITPGGSNLLRVVLSDAVGQRIVTLFSEAQ